MKLHSGLRRRILHFLSAEGQDAVPGHPGGSMLLVYTTHSLGTLFVISSEEYGLSFPASRNSPTRYVFPPGIRSWWWCRPWYGRSWEPMVEKGWRRVKAQQKIGVFHAEGL
ncbi:hypothetical protein ILYODFUR_028119 [Ilyodon furcidens]|uniref:Uncharacterized protein n=1 Tax=Ilyodon furcidens TaxID=33524 RepID=A0ABV0VHV5_9TELE